jgi:hypothetical protein
VSPPVSAERSSSACGSCALKSPAVVHRGHGHRFSWHPMRSSCSQPGERSTIQRPPEHLRRTRPRDRTPTGTGRLSLRRPHEPLHRQRHEPIAGRMNRRPGQSELNPPSARRPGGLRNPRLGHNRTDPRQPSGRQVAHRPLHKALLLQASPSPARGLTPSPSALPMPSLGVRPPGTGWIVNG